MCSTKYFVILNKIIYIIYIFVCISCIRVLCVCMFDFLFPLYPTLRCCHMLKEMVLS